MKTKSVINSFYIDAMSMKSTNMLLLVLIIIAMSVYLKPVSFIYIVTLTSLLFMNDEKGMHATNFAPVNKRSCVHGRYLFVLLSIVCCLTINLAVDLIAPVFYAEHVQGSFLFYAIMFSMSLLIVAIELPLLYQIGYAKVRIFHYLLFLAFAVFAMKVVGEDNLSYIMTSFSIGIHTTALLIAGATILFFCSLLISVKIYTKKDI